MIPATCRTSETKPRPPYRQRPTPPIQAAASIIRWILRCSPVRTRASASRPPPILRMPAARSTTSHTARLDAGGCSSGWRPVRPPAAQKKLKAAKRRAQPHAAAAARRAHRRDDACSWMPDVVVMSRRAHLHHRHRRRLGRPPSRVHQTTTVWYDMVSVVGTARLRRPVEVRGAVYLCVGGLGTTPRYGSPSWHPPWCEEGGQKCAPPLSSWPPPAADERPPSDTVHPLAAGAASPASARAPAILPGSLAAPPVFRRAAPARRAAG